MNEKQCLPDEERGGESVLASHHQTKSRLREGDQVDFDGEGSPGGDASVIASGRAKSTEQHHPPPCIVEEDGKEIVVAGR